MRGPIMGGVMVSRGFVHKKTNNGKGSGLQRAYTRSDAINISGSWREKENPHIRVRYEVRMMRFALVLWNFA